MTKHILQSKTVWGSLISLVSFAVMLFISKNASDKYFAVSGIISSIVAIYGRITAKHKLTLRRHNEVDRKLNQSD